MTTVHDLIDSRIRTAKVVLGEDDIRRLKAGLKAAGIEDTVVDSDLTIASAILDKYIANAESTRTVMTCPRCSGPMSQIKLATRRHGNFCSACRVVTPA